MVPRARPRPFRRPLAAPIGVALALALAAPLGAQGAVLVVDAQGGPGSQYTSIQAAIDAAAEGDAILVRPGAYAAFAIDGKSLTLEADVGPAKPSVSTFTLSYCTVRNLGPAQCLVMRGLDFPGVFLGTSLTLVLESCAGPVSIEDCRIEGGGPGLAVAGCAAVTLARSQLAGVDGMQGGSWSPGAGIESIGSNLFLYDCAVEGGDGYDGSFPAPPQSGAPAVRASSGSVFDSGSSLAGGSGGDGSPALFGACHAGAAGAPALWLAAGAPAAWSLDGALAGGAGGAAFSSCPPGSAGAAVQVDSGAHAALPGAHRSLVASSPLREAQIGQLSFQGQPGDLVFLGYAQTQHPVLALDFSGVIVPALASAVIQFSGALDLAGALTKPVAAPLLPAAAQSRGFHLQAVFASTSLAIAIGAPTHVLILDQAF